MLEIQKSQKFNSHHIFLTSFACRGEKSQEMSSKAKKGDYLHERNNILYGIKVTSEKE